MTSRERLQASLLGLPVDRPAVSFYEIGGFLVDPTDPSPYNIYNSPDWAPLLELAEQRSDLIRMAGANGAPVYPEALADVFTETVRDEGTSMYIERTWTVGGRTLTEVHRRDADLFTTWVIKHLLEDEEDVEAFLQLPREVFEYSVDTSNLPVLEQALGDRGIVMVETPDPLCMAAGLFSMADYTVIAFQRPDLFHRLLEMFAEDLYRRTRQVAREFPGHLWRIAGPEYASEPYLPPRLFEEYVVRYDRPIADAIHSTGGFARFHCHGRIRNILPAMIDAGADAIDPIEPAPQGDVTLLEVRQQYGDRLTLFGNIEICDLENLPTERFRDVVRRSLQEGTFGTGRGFVLMPSSAPYGRTLAPHVIRNYEVMLEEAEALA